MKQEIFETGDRVRITYQPPCEKEGLDHSIWPVVKDRTGRVLGRRRDIQQHPDHPYWVEIDGIKWGDFGVGGKIANEPVKGYFSPSELEKLDQTV